MVFYRNDSIFHFFSVGLLLTSNPTTLLQLINKEKLENIFVRKRGGEKTRYLYSAKAKKQSMLTSSCSNFELCVTQSTDLLGLDLLQATI